MKEIVIRCFVFLLMFVSCTPDCSEDDSYGIYEIEIAQAGDFEKFVLHSSLSAQEGDGSLIYSEEGKSKGVFYSFDETDLKKEKIRFYTAKKSWGLLFTSSTLKINEIEKDSMQLFITGYYNGKKILEKMHTFYSYSSDELYQEIVTDNALSIQLRDYR